LHTLITVKVRNPVKISENLTGEGKARLDQDLNVTLRNLNGLFTQN